MLNIPEELKNIYKNDRFPYADEVTPKDLIIYFPALDLTIETDQIVDDSFELDESLCSESDFVFGSCVAAKVKFTVADVEQDLTGQWLIINQIIEGYDPVPLGKFKVDSCVKQDNLRFKDITAYNILKDTDKDVAEWYNSLFPTGNETYTLKQFRESLLDYLGIEYEDETLPNDSMIVEKTVDAGQLSAREVLRRCVELQGAFGQVNRVGKFHHKVLEPAYGLYPSEDLFPGEDVYPVAEDDTSYVMPNTIVDTVEQSMVGANGIQHEEYVTNEIDKLIIRTDENDIGVIVGDGENAYVIQGNFLVFGKTAEALQEIARNAFGNMAKRPYRPYSAEIIGLPYIEPGDCLEFENGVRGYVLQRTLTGIQALKDEFIADGSEKREQHFGANTEIIQIKGRLMRFKKDIEGIRIDIQDLDRELSSEIEALAGQIVLKVNSEGKIGYIQLGADPDTDLTSIVIQADNISLNGYVGINNYIVVTEDGKLHAVDGEFTGTLMSSEFIGGFIRSANYYSGVAGMAIDLYNSTIDMVNLYVDPTGKIRSKNGEFEVSGPTGKVVIKDGKITLYNNALQATAELDGADIWANYIMVQETANFLGDVNFQLDSEPNLTIGGVSAKFLTTLNKDTYLNNYATKTWVQQNFAPASHGHSGYVTGDQLQSVVNSFNQAIQALWDAIGGN